MEDHSSKVKCQVYLTAQMEMKANFEIKFAHLDELQICCSLCATDLTLRCRIQIWLRRKKRTNLNPKFQSKSMQSAGTLCGQHHRYHSNSSCGCSNRQHAVIVDMSLTEYTVRNIRKFSISIQDLRAFLLWHCWDVRASSAWCRSVHRQ